MMNIEGYVALRKMGEELGGVDISTVPSDIMIFEFAELCGLNCDCKLQIARDAWYEDEVPKEGWVLSFTDESYHFWKDGKLRGSCCMSAMAEMFIGYGFVFTSTLSPAGIEYECSWKDLRWKSKRTVKKDDVPHYAKPIKRPDLPVTEKSV